MASHRYASAETIAAVAQASQDAQLGTIDSLDTKTSAILGLDGVILTLLFTSTAAHSHWNTLFSVGAASLGAATLPFLAALVPRKYHRNPNVIALAPSPYMESPPEETNRLIALSIARALALNQTILRWKVRAMLAGVFLTALGIAATAAGLLYSVT
jgi:hypothetical protein